MDLFTELQHALDAFEDGALWQPVRTLRRNEFLIEAGTRDDHFYRIEEGTIRIFLETADEDVTFRLGYGGNFIGALDTLLTGKPSMFSFQAIKATVVRPVTGAGFQRFLAASPAHADLWSRIKDQVIVDQSERELDLITRSPAERYERLLKRSPHLFQEVPHKYIASYLRMSPETLSRLQKS